MVLWPLSLLPPGDPCGAPGRAGGPQGVVVVRQTVWLPSLGSGSLGIRSGAGELGWAGLAWLAFGWILAGFWLRLDLA